MRRYTRDCWFNGGKGFQKTYDVWEHTAQRLAWAHGHERAAEIVAVRDPATRADLAAWKRLGDLPTTRSSAIPAPVHRSTKSLVDDRTCRSAQPAGEDKIPE